MQNTNKKKRRNQFKISRNTQFNISKNIKKINKKTNIKNKRNIQ